MTSASTLPLGWAIANIGDVADVATGKTPPTAEKQLYNGPHPFVKPGDLDGPQPLLTTESTVTRAAFDFAPCLPPGSVLVSCIGNLGKSAILGVEGTCNQQLNAILPSPAATPGFLHAWVRMLGPWLKENSSATTVSIINKGRFLRAPIRVPPLNEQKRIVAKIEELTARSRRAKEALEAVPPLLDKLRQSILAAAFRGDLTADWRAKNPNVEPADQLLARIRTERRIRWEAASKLKALAKGRPQNLDFAAKYKEPVVDSENSTQTLPRGWVWGTTELAGDILLGRRRAAQEYIEGEEGRVLRPYVRVANVKYDRLVLDDVFSMPFNPEELETYRLQPGDIVLSEGQSPELVGQSGVFEGNYDNLCIQATVHRFRAYEFATTFQFAQLVFLSHLHTGVFRRAASLTTNIAHLTSERLRPLPFPLPPLAEQAVIVERVRASLAKVAQTSRICSQMRPRIDSTDASILAKAFRGELVPQDPNDEPASVLLDRIRTARETSTPTAKSRRPRAAKPTPKPAPPPPEPAQLPLELDAASLPDEAFAALWLQGPLDKDAAVRKLADHLRALGRVEFQRLRAEGPLYAQLLAAIEAAVKAGLLDRPHRGQVRAFKLDATDYTPDDWRDILLASLGAEPLHQDDAIRQAAEWARDNLGLAFERLRNDGHIATGLRSAVTRAIRAGLVRREGPKRIALASG